MHSHWMHVQKTGVIFDNLVAVCELVNCSASQVQVTGMMPTVAVDKCDGIQARISRSLAVFELIHFQYLNPGKKL